MCGELVTKGRRGGQTEQAGRRRKKEAQVPLSRLHLLRGTPRTRAGWGSADSATPHARCLSTFQSPGKTSHVGRGLSGNGRGQRAISLWRCLVGQMEGLEERLVPSTEWQPRVWAGDWGRGG